MSLQGGKAWMPQSLRRLPSLAPCPKPCKPVTHLPQHRKLLVENGGLGIRQQHQSGELLQQGQLPLSAPFLAQLALPNELINRCSLKRRS
jgi:hypothetical protein